MIILLLCLSIFGTSLFHLFRRVRQEARRQRALSWPRATATLGELPDTLAHGRRLGLEQRTYYRAELRDSYVFYAQGKRYTGNRIAPGLEDIEATDARRFLGELARHRRYAVHFNPDRPEENYLTVGPEVLGYLQVMHYASAGFLFPFVILRIFDPLHPGRINGALLFLVILIVPVFLNILYQQSKPPLRLSRYLIPAGEAESLPTPSEEPMPALQETGGAGRD